MPEDSKERRPATQTHPFLRIEFLVLILGVATYLFFHFDLHIFFMQKEKVIAFIESFGPLSVLIFIILQITQVLLAPLPGEITGFIGGYLYGPVLGTLYSTIGLTIGSWCAFILSRTLGLPFVEKVVNPKILQKYDYFMEHHGIFVTFILFLLPGFPKDAMCYILGLSHMNTRIFLIVATIGRLLGTVMLSLGGSFLRNDQKTAFFITAVAAAVIVIVAFFFRDHLLRRLRKKNPHTK